MKKNKTAGKPKRCLQPHNDMLRIKTNHQHHHQQHHEQQHHLHQHYQNRVTRPRTAFQLSDVLTFAIVYVTLVLVYSFLWGAASGLETNNGRMNDCFDNTNGFEDHLLGDGEHYLNVTTLSPLERAPDHQPGDISGDGQSANILRRSGAMTTRQTISGLRCCCWNSTNKIEMECRCEGDALKRVPQLTVPLQRLIIASAGLNQVRNEGLKLYAATLWDIVMTDLPQLEDIHDGAFSGLRQLRTIYISHAPKLTRLSKEVFRGISDTIKIIRIINSGLISMPDFSHLPSHNIMEMIDLDNNEIGGIEKESIDIKTDQLILANNDIRFVEESAFLGSQIAKLIMKENRNLKEIHPNAFIGMSFLRELDLSSTSLTHMPSLGLQDIELLRIENTPTLKTIPSIYNFKNLQKAYLTHSFHCCAFKYPSRHDPQRHAERLLEIQKWRKKCHNGNGNHDNPVPDSSGENVQHGPLFVGHSEDTSAAAGIFYSGLGSGESSPAFTEDASVADFMDDQSNPFDSAEMGTFHEEITIDPQVNQLDEMCGNFTFREYGVECWPKPDALNPCEDVMGYSLLRMSVWVVVMLAVVGNVAVLVVIMFIKSESNSVPRFLMRHLAFADLCLGLYLLLIASIDAHSMGEYFNYAYDWQYGAGCKVAGFLSVFSSHLSVFTLTIITIERWFAITHALFLNHRLKIKTAAYLMASGWLYSIVMSLMPLFGISSYSSTSICLPMEIRDSFDIAFLVSVLGLNGVAFFIIAVCYGQIYLSLDRETRHNSHPGERSIAKKMALLVFTNFACWAPIAFFGLTALAGYPLINVTRSKILLVFFYPLNSCADPYLYAILTSQYRQDLYTLLLKLGIGRNTIIKYKDSGSIPPTARASLHRQSTCSNKSNKAPEAQFMLKHHEDFV